MTIYGGHAKVMIQEIDLSVRVPGFRGVYGAIVLPSKKGQTEDARLITSEQDLLANYSFDGKLSVGEDLAFFSAFAFLQKSDKLWVKRPKATDSLHGGLEVRSINEEANTPWDSGEEDPTAKAFSSFGAFHLYSKDVGAWADRVHVCVYNKRSDETISISEILNFITSEINVSSETALKIKVAQPLYKKVSEVLTALTHEGDITPLFSVSGLAGFSAEYTIVGTDHYLDFSFDAAASGDKINILANTLFDSTGIEFVANTFTFDGTTWSSLRDLNAGALFKVSQNLVTGEPFRISISTPSTLPPTLSVSQAYFTIKQASGYVKLSTSLQGALNGTNIVQAGTGGSGSFKLISMKEFKETKGSLIEVYKDTNLTTPVEKWYVSMEEDALNGNNQSMFIEDVLLGSQYIRALKNPLNLSEVLPQISPLALHGGDDGDPITVSNMVQSVQIFRQKDTYPVTVIMDGGWSIPSYQREIDEIAQSRHDCVGLLSVPYSVQVTSNFLNDIVDWRLNVQNINSSHSALYASHVKVLDTDNNRYLWVSPEGYAGAAIAHTAYNYEMWYPVAGFKRGVINVEDCLLRFKPGEMDYLYDNGINPIRYYSGKGIVIWGQKTLQAQPSALDRLNVRLLLVVIEPAIAEALESFLFELNDEGTRRQAEIVIGDYMDLIKSKRGVYDFYVQCNKDNNPPVLIDQNAMAVHLFIQPTKSIEYIPFTVVITSTGFSLSLAQELVGAAG